MQTSPVLSPVEVSRSFAQALDSDDFASAAALLSEDCVYEARQATFVGPAAICDSYREASTWGRTTLDSLAYDSQVQEPMGNVVPVVFMDHITHRGKHLSYACKQFLRVNARGQIVQITHAELPGQREALVSFLESLGLSRP